MSDIRADPEVALGFQGEQALWVTVQGHAELIQDKGQLREYGSKDLDRWSKNDVDTPGVTMVKVVAARIHYWEGEEDGEVGLSPSAGDRGARRSPGLSVIHQAQNLVTVE